MALVSVLVSLFSFILICSCHAKLSTKTKAAEQSVYPYEVGYYNQFIDHFNEASYKDHTYKQKFLFSTTHWKKGAGPVFFYTGNEGPIEAFWDASGFVHELAAEMEALVIFAEHRFYGSSLPFGKDSLRMPYLGLLTIDQAMADYAILISNILKHNNATKCKVIAFGGSYGGMLAAYMRFKYPNIVHGSLAASAPIYMQDPAAKRDFFFPLVSKDFSDQSKLCADLTIRIFSIIEMFSKDAPGLQALGKYFRLCEPLGNQEDYNHFLEWLRNAFVMMSMMDYPYSTDFEGHFPAFPVKAACDALTTSHNPLYGFADLVGVYYNSTRKLKCFDIHNEYIKCADPTGCGLGPDAIAWDYQACTEVWLPEGSNGKTDIFPDLPWTDTMRAAYCLKTYGVMPRHDWPSIQFWGEDIKSASNIIFSNGDLDPWRGGGVLKDVTGSVVAINVKGGAHHLDLRASNKADPPGVTEARQKEREIIRKWVNN